jgi:hypothetical protein
MYCGGQRFPIISNEVMCAPAIVSLVGTVSADVDVKAIPHVFCHHLLRTKINITPRICWFEIIYSRGAVFGDASPTGNTCGATNTRSMNDHDYGTEAHGAKLGTADRRRVTAYRCRDNILLTILACREPRAQGLRWNPPGVCVPSVVIRVRPVTTHET